MSWSTAFKKIRNNNIASNIVNIKGEFFLEIKIALVAISNIWISRQS